MSALLPYFRLWIPKAGRRRSLDVTMLAPLIFLLCLQCVKMCDQCVKGGPEVVTVHADLSRVMNRVSDRFLSVAIDTSLATDEKYMYLLTSQKLRTLAQALSPAFLRFGGTKQDFMIFTPPKDLLKPLDDFRKFAFTPTGHVCDRLVLPMSLEKRLRQDWAKQEVVLQKEEVQDHYTKVRFSEHSMDLLYAFANCSGFDLIFGLNALLRTRGNAWDSHNAEVLLSYCENQTYSMSWELGNEPNSYEKKAGVRVDGYQLGRDFVRLRGMLQKSRLYRGTGLYGPDIGQPRDHRRDLLEGFLETGVKAINACTWHHYYVNGREATLEDFLSPEVLDTLVTKTNEVLKTVNHLSPGEKVWLGETSSAYGGGAPGLSDTFVAGFMWLDKLGLAAKLGIDVVIRHVLFGSGTYHLVDSNLDPLPDYWLSVLYKRLVGPEVLDVAAFSSGAQKKPLRVYMHCTNKSWPNYRRGAVTLFTLNLGTAVVNVSLPWPVRPEAFVLEPGGLEPGMLQSRSVRLNGAVLKMVNDSTLPPLQGTPLPREQSLRVPGQSFAFYVLKDAGATACE